MHLIAVSINHRTADVALREKVAFKDDAIRSANVDLFETKSILENVILSTCNRTEIYAVTDQVHTGRYYIKQFLADWLNVDKEDVSPYLPITESDATVEHLFRVASGLDSVVLVETKFFGQDKYACYNGRE